MSTKILNGETLYGPLVLIGEAAPAVSSAGNGTIYFDSSSNLAKVSQNGHLYVPLSSSGFASIDAFTYSSYGGV
jgi:hypothetical protein